MKAIRILLWEYKRRSLMEMLKTSYTQIRPSQGNDISINMSCCFLCTSSLRQLQTQTSNLFDCLGRCRAQSIGST